MKSPKKSALKKSSQEVKMPERKTPDELSMFDFSICDRKIHNTDELNNSKDYLASNDDVSSVSQENTIYEANNRAMIWHVRFGHASVAYLKALQLKFPDMKNLQSAQFNESTVHCEVCLYLASKSSSSNMQWPTPQGHATERLEIIHSDVIGPFFSSSYPKGYNFYSVFVDDYSRLAMVYPMVEANETGRCLEMFVKDARNLLGHDAKVCYLRLDRNAEGTGGYTSELLDKLGLKLQFYCPGIPAGVSDRCTRTIMRKVRVYMDDTQIPEYLWDLAVSAAVYAYNRTPEKSNNMITPLEKFAPNHNFDINQIKRFGCACYMGIPRRFGAKFKPSILVGYTPSGYLCLRPEDGKYYEAENVRFNEELVYGDLYDKYEIEDFKEDDENAVIEKSLIRSDENGNKSKELSSSEGDTNESETKALIEIVKTGKP